LTGTSYEGTRWLQATNTPQGAAFADVSWVGGRRAREGDWTPTAAQLNDLNINEGDMGMAWAAYTLSGVTINQNPIPDWSPQIQNHQTNSQVVFDGQIWQATGWMGTGASPATHNVQNRCRQTEWGSTQCEAHWVLVGPIPEPTRVRTNPDGSPITMTFNVISGLFTAVSPGGTGSYMRRESRFGWYRQTVNAIHDRIPVAWGRENAIFNTRAEMLTRDNTNAWADGTIEAVFRRAIVLGHEIGNHTIDHMESNSPLPNTVANPWRGAVQGEAHLPGFGRWQGDGFITEGGPVSTTVMPDGQQMTVNQVTHFGQTPGDAWQYMGWENQAGRALSIRGWRGLIELGEEELVRAFPEIRTGIGDNWTSNQIVGFRAPRLEVNSNLQHALKQLGYLFDTGLEEGYEYNVDGSNFLWPYTICNGSPNVAWQRAVGSNRSNWDSLPTGLWQYPVSVFIVPENHRQAIWNNYVRITGAAADGTIPTDADRNQFLQQGRITGFDFNLFILWGATRQIATATLNHSLAMRMGGGRAPFQIGSHTDYFTPIYDHATLLNSLNAPSYGLNVTEGWNTWRDRIAVYEDFVNHGRAQGAYFLSGRQTIEYVAGLVAQVRVGSQATTVPANSWQFFNHGAAGSASLVQAGTLDNGLEISVNQAANNLDAIVTGFTAPATIPVGTTHISLNYSITAPITIRLLTGQDIDNQYPFEVTLSNLNGFNNWNDNSNINRNRWIASGQIPLHAFQRQQYVGLTDNLATRAAWMGLNPPTEEFLRTVTAIEIRVQKPLAGQFSWRSNHSNYAQLMQRVRAQRNYIAVRDFTFHHGATTLSLGEAEVNDGRGGGNPSGLASTPVRNSMPRTAIMGMTANNLNLSIARAGVYNVDIITANGRVVQSFRDVNLTAGVNSLPLGRMATGMYMIRIHNQNFNTTLRSMLR
jgi:peptidoglycan/xylan/chitin deacetylase (PgdA/CDA1 family)